MTQTQQSPKKIYIGSTEVKKVYLGTHQVRPAIAQTIQTFDFQND